MSVVYHVCDECTVAIVNADCTSYDVDIDAVTAFMERVGYLVDAGMVPKPGYWDCESCDQTQIGSAHALETVDESEPMDQPLFPEYLDVPNLEDRLLQTLEDPKA